MFVTFIRIAAELLQFQVSSQCVSQFPVDGFRPFSQLRSQPVAQFTQVCGSGRSHQDFGAFDELASFSTELGDFRSLLQRRVAADVEVNVEVFDELVGEKISLWIEIGWTQCRSPVDAQIDSSLNRVAPKQSAVFVIKYSEVPFAVARKRKDFEVPIRA